MKVLIVSKTRMGGGYCCVGGLDIAEKRSLRLLQRNGFNQREDTQFRIGHIWDIKYIPNVDLIPPHIEDVRVLNARFEGIQSNLSKFLLEKIKPWRNGPEALFDGKLSATGAGSGYVSKQVGVPSCSTGFWLLDKPLAKSKFEDKVRYRYPETHGIRYLTLRGYNEPVDTLPTGTLLRVSLARWWKPEDTDVEERCYLQLSGWYL
ncbi:MAG: hypothetical protein KAR20_03655 [Candidatus Heimdallarchaeota archaeon]|nr:hypothetical protein [Candidatus Heimdallarchaeota archaeon]